MKKNKQVFEINLGERIKKFRLLSNLSIKNVQSLLYQYNYQISEKVIYKWEKNIITPNLTCILMLCDIFNITTTTFFQNPDSKKSTITKQEIDFILAIRNNEMYKKIIKNLYNKEVLFNVKNRTKTKNTSKD